jgi:3-oxoacyl-[acyl-carrier protein] reductase
MGAGLEGHVAVITGAGQGLGADIAASLGAKGCRVVVWDIDAEAAQQVTKAIRSAGGDAIEVVGNVCDTAQVMHIRDEIIDTLGSVQILVNCAGFSRDSPITTMSDDQWYQVINVCLTAPFLVTRALVASMIDQQYGRIVNISSRARFGDFNKCNYSAAKAGLVGLTAALSLELGKSGVTVNAIAPGFIETERIRGLSHFEEMKGRALAGTFTPRLGTPADVSDAVSYLVAPQSGFITGEVLTISGGRLR